MALTPAEKQARYRAKQAAQLERLRKLAAGQPAHAKPAAQPRPPRTILPSWPHCVPNARLKAELAAVRRGTESASEPKAATPMSDHERVVRLKALWKSGCEGRSFFFRRFLGCQGEQHL